MNTPDALSKEVYHFLKFLTPKAVALLELSLGYT